MYSVYICGVNKSIMKKQDVTTYTEMAKPHPSDAEAKKAVQKFFETIEAARKECKIANVLVAINDTKYIKENEAEQFATVLFIGDETRMEVIAAHAFGKARKNRDEMIAKMIGGNE